MFLAVFLSVALGAVGLYPHRAIPPPPPPLAGVPLAVPTTVDNRTQLAFHRTLYADPSTLAVEWILTGPKGSRDGVLIARDHVYGDTPTTHPWAWHPWSTESFSVVTWGDRKMVREIVVPTQQAGYGNLACVLFGSGTVRCWCPFVAGDCPYTWLENTPCVNYEQTPWCYSPLEVPDLLRNIVAMAASGDHHVVVFAEEQLNQTVCRVLGTPGLGWSESDTWVYTGQLQELSALPLEHLARTTPRPVAVVYMPDTARTELWVAISGGMARFSGTAWEVARAPAIRAFLPSAGAIGYGWPGFIDTHQRVWLYVNNQSEIAECFFKKVDSIGRWARVSMEEYTTSKMVATVWQGGLAWLTKNGELVLYGAKPFVNNFYPPEDWAARVADVTEMCVAGKPNTGCGTTACRAHTVLPFPGPVQTVGASVMQASAFGMFGAGLARLEDGRYWRWGVNPFAYPPTGYRDPLPVFFSDQPHAEKDTYELLAW